MSQASTEMDALRSKMLKAVDLLSTDDLKAMLREHLRTANTWEMTTMVEASSFRSLEKMEWDLDLVD